MSKVTYSFPYIYELGTIWSINTFIRNREQWVKGMDSARKYVRWADFKVWLSNLTHWSIDILSCKEPNIIYWNINQQCFYLYEDWQVARGPLSGKLPLGPGHRSADWACSGGGALSAAAPGMHWVGVLCTAGQRYYAQILVPSKCMYYPPGSNDMPPPGTQRERRKSDEDRFFFRPE